MEKQESIIGFDDKPKIIASEYFRKLDEELNLDIFELITAAVPEGISVLDLEGNIIMTTKRLADIIGYDDPVDLIGKNIFSSIMVEQHEGNDEDIDTVLMGNISNTDHSVLRLDGRRIVLNASMAAITDKMGNSRAIVAIFRDVSDIYTSTEELRTSEEENRVLIETASDAIIVTDQNGRILSVNPSTSSMSGYSSEELIGKTVEELFHLQLDDNLQNDGLIKSTNLNIFRQILRKDGTAISVKISSNLLPNGQRMAIVHDISEQVDALNEVRYLSYHDALTGLFNRRYFEEELDKLQKTRRYPIGVFVIDLDNFKHVNDSEGHAAGDDLLKKTANLLMDIFRRTDDAVCRTGGDEFTILIPSLDVDIEKMLDVSLRNAFDIAAIPASIGFAIATEWDTPLREIVKNADDLMYLEKKKNN